MIFKAVKMFIQAVIALAALFLLASLIGYWARGWLDWIP